MSGQRIELALPRRGAARLEDVALRLDPRDDVAIARMPLAPGLRIAAETEITVQGAIPLGHKIALRAREIGEPVRRYGQVIGHAAAPISPGDHVHTHNLSAAAFGRTYSFATDPRPVQYVPESQRRTFMGYRRADGRVGTRNYVAVISSVNCSASASRYVADRFTADVLRSSPHVDGVIALVHKGGCATHYGGQEDDHLQRVLAGFATHPNVAGYVLMGLGCEANQIPELVERQGLVGAPSLIIQEEGGLVESVEAGARAVAELLPSADACRRESAPASDLMLALQCGGSDAWSGVTANPALGYAADLLVAQGGAAVLGETPEVYGAEHLLTRRAVSEEVGRKLLDRIAWWERYAAMHGVEIDNNPSPGNKLGGLTTIFEKSLGAVAKSGTTPMTDVVAYAERVQARGFVHMDTPGFDPVSVTGQVAGGCNLVAFTTGRGSVFGCRPAPSIKIATTTDLYRRMGNDMDVDAGSILSGSTIRQVGEEIFELLLRVASGEQTKSERHGLGEEEFNPWIVGAVL